VKKLPLYLVQLSVHRKEGSSHESHWKIDGVILPQMLNFQQKFDHLVVE
jgi:hypothetical protein